METQGTAKRRNGTISSRLATVETRVEALHHSVESMTTSLESLARQLGNVGKMNWPLLVASIGVLATWTGVIAFVGEMAIEPVKVELSNVQTAVKSHQADGHPHTVIGQVNSLSSRMNERFAEVETQIKAVRHIRDLDREHARELLELKARLVIYESRHGPLSVCPAAQPSR